MLLYTIERLKELYNSLLICLRRGRKARAVYAIVDVVICPLVRLFDFLPQSLWEEVHFLILLREEIIELRSRIILLVLAAMGKISHTSV